MGKKVGAGGRFDIFLDSETAYVQKLDLHSLLMLQWTINIFALDS